jgi:hypothetical protein
MVVVLPLIYRINVIRNIQQVTNYSDRQIYNPLDIFSRDESSPWYGVNHMLCTFHLVEQQFDNDVLNKEDREGIVYQVKIGYVHLLFIVNVRTSTSYRTSYVLSS